MKEQTPQPKRLDERTFSVTRKGYDPREVSGYLEELEFAFQEIEGHARRTSQKVVELERELAVARSTEKVSLDNAMMAVFDVKDRMIDRAERRAEEIREEAGLKASELLAEVVRSRGREPELENQITALEQELVRNRADGERLRMQLEDAHTALDHIETTTTVDITSLQTQLKHEQEQNAKLRSAARELDFVQREFDHKLAQAQEQAMLAKAEAEEARAELEALRSAAVESETDTDSGRVVYERPSDVSDYEFAVASYRKGYSDRLSEAI